MAAMWVFTPPENTFAILSIWDIVCVWGGGAEWLPLVINPMGGNQRSELVLSHCMTANYPKRVTAESQVILRNDIGGTWGRVTLLKGLSKSRRTSGGTG